MLDATLEGGDRFAKLLLLRQHLFDLERLLLNELLVGRLLLDKCAVFAHYVRVVFFQFVELTEQLRLFAVELNAPSKTKANE